jgi:hypothetical protein
MWAWRLAILSCVASGLTFGQITTSQYDNQRTGANLKETVLNPRNIAVGSFGRLYKFEVDGDVYAQPLFLPHLSIPGKGEHDVLFVATEHDSVYAFDAEQAATPLWKVSFTDRTRGISTVSAESVGCPFISPDVGITSTPVIDPRSGTLYVLARTAEKDNRGTRRFWQKLHALDVLTGAEKFGGPVVIRASIKNPNSGPFGLFSSSLDFGALRENPRAALTLANSMVYLTWASSCDVGPYHGWIMAYDAHTLKQSAAFNTSPTSTESGIWQSDTGPAVDEFGNLFLSTGNGKFDVDSGGKNYGDSLFKIASSSRGLSVADYFTPSEQAELNSTDGDLGSGGPLLIPEQSGSFTHLIVVGGKSGTVYVVNRDRMGGFVLGNNRHAVQTIKLGGGIMGAPAYWNGHLYYFSSNDVLKDFTVQAGRLSGEPAALGTNKIADPGATPSVSANGSQDGIVWVVQTKGWRSDDRPAVLYAYDAQNVTNELYDSEQNAARDRAGIARRFVIPVVANGRVYVATSGEVDVYGLLSSSIKKGAPPAKPGRRKAKRASE